MKINKTGLGVDIDETLSWTVGHWAKEMQKLFGNPEGLSAKELVDKYSYTQNVPYWQSEEALKWMEEKRIAPEYLKTFNWDAFDMAAQTQEMQDQIEVHIGNLFALFTKEELYNEALKRGIMLCPVNTSKDILGNAQLKDRKFWVDINHPELSTDIRYPGVFAKLSETPLNIERRAPLIGEHNLEIYHSELGYSESELKDLQNIGVI